MGTKQSRNRLTKAHCFRFFHRGKREKKRELPINDVWCQKKQYDWNIMESHCLYCQCQIRTKGTWCYLIQRNHKSGARKNIWQQLKMFCKCAYIFINMTAEADQLNKCASRKVIWKSKKAINYFVTTTLFNFISGDLSALIQNWNFNTKLQPATEAAYLKTQSFFSFF